MAVRCGLVGLPNAGKSTLFNAVTCAAAAVAAHPFTTIEPNTGVLALPDERLPRLAEIIGSARLTPAALLVVDIAGLVRGASRGEGLGNRFLAHIREVDAVLHVVRAFEDPRVAHVQGELDPVRDMATVNEELRQADLETVRARREKVLPRARAGGAEAQAQVAALDRLAEALSGGVPARALAAADPAVQDLLPGMFLLTAKPVIYVVNLGEAEAARLAAGRPAPAWEAVRAAAAAEGAPAVPLAARLEAELRDLGADDRAAFREAVGVAEDGVRRLVGVAFEHLRLVSFFTANENEARAWPVPAGLPAARAAGKVHSDMEAGFIRAEVVAFSDLDRAGSVAAARERGWLRVEGRDYPVKDGDVLWFRFRTDPVRGVRAGPAGPAHVRP